MIFLVLLIAGVLGGIIAYSGDVIGRRIGRKHLRLFGLRPKTTGIVVAVASGVGVALVSVGILALLARDTLQNAERANIMRAELAAIKEEKTRLESDYAELQAQFAQSNQDLGDLRQESTQIRDELKAAETLNDSLQARLGTVSSEIAAKTTQLASLEQNYKQQLADVERKNQEKVAEANRQANTQIQQANTEAAAKIKKVSGDADNRIAQAKRDADVRSKALQLEVTKLAGQRDGIATELNRLKNNRTALQGRIAQLNTDKATLLQRVDDTEQRATASTNRLAGLSMQIGKLEQSKNTLENDVTGLRQQRDFLVLDNKKLLSQNGELQNESDQLSEDLRQAQLAVTQASLGNFIFRRAELVAQTVIVSDDAGSIRSQLEDVLAQAEAIAEGRGAARRDLADPDLVDRLVGRLARSVGADLVVLRSKNNLPARGGLELDVRAQANIALYRAGQPLSTTTIIVRSGNALRSVDDVTAQLMKLCREVQNDLRAKGVPLENIPPGLVEASMLQGMAEYLRKQGNNTTVSVLAEVDVLPSGPLGFMLNAVKP
jgi:predicted nuclease with TOPRIM domain